MNTESRNALPVLHARPALMATIVLTVLIAAASVLVTSCAPAEAGPVPLYPEDQCASCRMAVSNRAFASQIVFTDGSAAKFDDLRCLDNYRHEHPNEAYAAIFVSNYETSEWMPYALGVIVQTGIETPMGSGRVAVADQKAAARLKEQYPPKLSAEGMDACCAGPKTESKK